MDKNKTRPKRKASEDYERGITKRTRQTTTGVTSRSTSSVSTRYSHKDGSGMKSADASKDGDGTQRSSDKARPTSTTSGVSRVVTSGSRDADRLESKSSMPERQAGSSETASSRARSRPERSDKQRLDVSKLDRKIMEMVGSSDADLFKLVYNISVGAVDPVKCVDVIRFYLSNSEYESASDKDMAKSSSNEDTTDKDDANASENGSEERKSSGSGMLIFKLLDLVSFFLDVSKKKTNLLYFLQALETLGINKEIISTIDANKLDNCNYSEGLVKILIRERTRNNYVLKVFNLYRECPKGFLALTTYLSSLTRSKVNKGVEDGVSNGTDVNTVCDTIKKITGSYKLCPLRVLYEVLNWLVLGYFNAEFVLGLLSMYNVKQIRFCVLFYLQVSSGVSDKSNASSGNTEEVKETAGKDSKGASGDVGVNKQGEIEGGSKASNVESGINTTCSGIYYLIALLVTNGYMRLEDVYKYLSPSDALIKQLSSHFISTVKSGSVSANLDSSSYSGTGSGSRGGATKADNVVLVDLLKSASFYTISNEYLNSCEQNSSKARRVEHMLEIFSDPKYSGFPASFTSDQSTTGSHKDDSPSRTFSGAGSSSVSKSDTNPLLSMNNYRLLKNCFYAYNFPKVALLSNILGLCEDFTGGNWNLCYSLIVHLFRHGYYVFFNTSLVHRFNRILAKVLDGSSCSTATKNTDTAATTSTKLDLAKEWVILKKVEYYFMFVGFRACEDTVLFNRVLRYLYNLLQQVDVSSQKSTKGSGKAQKNAADGGSSGGLKLKLKVTKLIYKYVLFNIMNCCEGNFQVSDKIWNILKMFTTLERYQIYSKSYHFLTKYKLESRVGSMVDEDNSTTDNSEASVGISMRTMYYVNQLCFVRRTHQIYNHKLKNIFKKITGELLRSVKSPTIRSIVSIITAISAINPFSVGTLIIKQSEMFNNLLLPLCELTKYFQAYTIDVFIYQLTVNLLSLIGSGSGGKDGNGRGSAKSRGDKVSLSDMRLDCNNLMKEDDNNKINVNSIILCKIFKRHNECDIAPLITVLVLLLNYSLSNKLEIRHSGSGDLLGVNSLSGSGSQGLGSSRSKKASATAKVVKQVDIQLDSNNYYDVVFMIYKVLDYLINLFELMNGIIIIDMNKMTKDQLLSQCGSFSLKTESQLMNLDDEVNLSNKKVFKIVSRPFFLHSLLLILGRLLNELVYDSYFTNHKLLVEVVNKYHSVVMLLVEFLSTSTNEITGMNRVVTGAISEESGLVKYDNNVVNEFLSTLSKYYAGNYIDFFRQYLFGGVNGKGSLESCMASGGEESVLEDKFVEYVNTLNIYDIYVPVEQYDHYINKLLNHYNQLSPTPLNLAEALVSKSTLGENNSSSNKTEPASPVNPPTRGANTVGTRITNGTLMRRLKRIKNRITALAVDKQSHQAHNSVVLGRLKEMLQSFVKNEQKVGPHVTIAFISKIIYPRVFISVLNSMFCCKLVDLMMAYRVNYFNYFDFVNCYCKLLVPLINYSTEAEVINFSLFFNYSFNMIKNWINSKEAFESMVKDNPCFCLTFRFNPEKQFKYEQLLQVLKKWEYLILVSLFSCYTVTSTESKGGNRGTGPTVGGDMADAEGMNEDASDKGDVDATNVGDEPGNPADNEQKIGRGSEEVTGDNSIESITTNNDNGSDQDGAAGVSPSNKNGGKADGSDSIGDVGDGNDTVTYGSGNDDSALTPVNGANVSGVDGASSAEPIGRLSSWIEIKNVVIFLNKVSANFPVSHNSSVKVVNFLKSVLKVSKRENWQDVTVSANTLIKTMQMYQNQNKYITLG